MKINLKAAELVEKGLSVKTLSKLNENEIEILHSRFLFEKKEENKEEIKKSVTNVTYDPTNPTDQQKLAQKGIHIDPGTKKITMSLAGEKITTEEVTEDDEIEKDPFQQTSDQDPKQTGPGEYGNDPKTDKEMDTEDADGMGMMESKKTKKNPWAICTAQMGEEFGTTERSEWSKSQMKKYERCVMDVKKTLKEGKNPISLFIENEIMKIVEKNIQPRITKGDLMKYLVEQGPSVAPSKPKTEPAKKPGKPDVRPKPKHPGKNPMPSVKPAPKAMSPEKAKDEVLDLIKSILEKK